VSLHLFKENYSDKSLFLSIAPFLTARYGHTITGTFRQRALLKVPL